MTRLERWLLHAANLLVGGTGAVYTLMLYGMAPAGDYAVVNHPLQPLVQHLHLLAAPLLVFAAGLIWRGHVSKNWGGPATQRRQSAWPLLLSIAPMVASGYLIQVSTGDGWRAAWVALHLASSALWLGAYLVHVLAPRLAPAGGGARDPERVSGSPAEPGR